MVMIIIEEKHNKIVFSAKAIEVNTIEVLISKALLDSYIKHKEYFLANNFLR